MMQAREFLRDPYFPLHAAHTLGVDITWAPEYQRAKVPLKSHVHVEPAKDEKKA